MEFGHYTDRTALVAAGLVNLYRDPDAAPRAADVRALLQEHGQRVGRVSTADLAALGTLAGRLRRVFTAASPAVALRVLNALMTEADVRPRVVAHDGTDPHLHFSALDAPLVQRVTATTAMGLAVVFCNHGPSRLGACPADGCRRVFIDTSRNATRRFCSDTCANRTNVAAHRARARAETPSGTETASA